MLLQRLVENTPADELAPMPRHESADFIEAALRTAIYSTANTRSTILADVCEVLGCRIEDLNFLFDHQTVPTKHRSVLGLELPDYRMRQSEIYKIAAE